jgi:hypothetical protein
MRVVVLVSAALALLAMRPPSGAAAGPWCYFGNEDVYCDQVSFEMCHFGTLGNGGYCGLNPSIEVTSGPLSMCEVAQDTMGGTASLGILSNTGIRVTASISK